MKNKIMWKIMLIAKLNSNFNFNLNLNWVEFSITFILSDHPPTQPPPPGLVVELQLHQQLRLLASTKTLPSPWACPISATACVSIFFLLSFFSIATFDKVVGLICHRHCQKMGGYSDTVVLICHTHCQKIWWGSWPDMSRTLSENGLIQWHGLPDLSHTLSEIWMITLS